MSGSRLRTALLVILLATPLARARSQESGTTIRLTLDATAAPQKILHSTLVMPVKPGPLTVYYPKWIPGEHEPSGPVGNIAELKFTANGKIIPWRRDVLDVYTFHLDVPEGSSSLEITFDYLEPSGGPYSGGASATDKLVVVSWNQNVLYPAGARAEEIIFHPTLRLPEGWKFGTPLPVENQSGNEVRFKPVELDRLVDSPVVAGEYFRAVDVTPEGEPIHHEVDLVADSEAALAMSPEVEKDMKNLVAESGKLFGARRRQQVTCNVTGRDMAPLSRLPFPADALEPRGAFWPRAPRVER